MVEEMALNTTSISTVLMEPLPTTVTEEVDTENYFLITTSTTDLPFENVTKNGTFNITQRNVSFAKYYPYLAAEMLLSIVCLLVLVFIYYRIKEHKTIPGKIVLSLSGCFILCYSLLIVDFLMRTRISLVPCVLLALLIHSLFLAAFFWTNVMAYDIMRTMSSIKPNLSGPSARYWKYALYAWTMTMVCSVPAFVVDNIYSVPELYRPKFGRKRCWLSGTPAFLMYFNGPVGFILLANCIMFIVTACTIVKVKNAAVAARVKPHRTRFRLYIKLVIVMGLVWIVEFVPWWTGIYKLYAVAGILNCLHGVYIFVIFACKSRIWNKFKNTFEILRDDTKKQTETQFHTSPSCSTLAITESSSGSQNNLSKFSNSPS